jgi:Zn ribbon nucleic-acid-binding protein
LIEVVVTEKISPRRFIAGAVCPQCSSLDSIQLYFIQHEPLGQEKLEQLEQEKAVYECVECGYEEIMNKDGSGEVGASEQVLSFVDVGPGS